MADAEEIAAQRAKNDEEIAEKLAAYEAVRAEQREKEDQEIQELKEKQARRREEREVEETERRERERDEEQRRKAEEEERKAKMLEEKARRANTKRKGNKDAFALAGGPIVITKKLGDLGDEEKTKNKRVVGPSPEELDARKQDFLQSVTRAVDLSSMGADDIKKHIERLHERVCKVVADTYDLEKRSESQDYDYKELIGRQKQQARAKAVRMGLDPDEAENSKHPPKLKIVTKYDRQIDRRGYSDRVAVYNKAGANPHFPGVGAPESKLEKKILTYDDVPEEGEEEEAAGEEEAEEEPAAAEEEAAEEEEAEEAEEEEEE